MDFDQQPRKTSLGGSGRHASPALGKAEASAAAGSGPPAPATPGMASFGDFETRGPETGYG